MIKNLPANAGASGDVGSTPESGRSPGEGNGNLLLCSCWDNPMWAPVHGVAKSRTRLSVCAHTLRTELAVNQGHHKGSWCLVFLSVMLEVQSVFIQT